MKNLKIGDKVLFEGKECTIKVIQKDFSTKKLYYYLDEIKERVTFEQLKEVENSEAKVKFAQDLIDSEKEVEEVETKKMKRKKSKN